MSTPVLCVAVLCAALLAGLARPAAATDRLLVYAVNYPLTYFAERLGGNLVEVRFPAPADVDPAYWQPDPTVISRFQQADLILLNGADYARWTATSSLPRRVLVNTTAGQRDRYIVQQAGAKHRHGPAGAHVHDGYAITTWLDFDLAQAQAAAVATALRRRRPAQAAAIDERLVALQADLERLDGRLAVLEPDTPLLASHPVYQYLSARYELDIHAVDWEPDRMPDEAQWRELAALQTRIGARWMLWEGEPLPQIRTRLDDMGLVVVVFAPQGNRPAGGDFLDAMAANVARLEAALNAP